jgi:predicted small secreted protein
VKITFKRIALLLAASALAVAFSSSCSTTRGFGRDVEKLGGNIEESAS